jgi:integrase
MAGAALQRVKIKAGVEVIADNVESLCCTFEQGVEHRTKLGSPLDGNNVRERSFKRLLEKAGLPAMRFHNLRHGAATLLTAEGVPVNVISEMLGHADISTTLRIYSSCC